MTVRLRPDSRAGIDLFAGLDHVDAGKVRHPTAADPFPGRSRTQQPGRLGRRQIERPAGAQGGEIVVAQQPGYLRRRERIATAKGGPFQARPEPPTVGHHHQQTGLALHHPPDLLHHITQVIAVFHAVHQQHPVDRVVWQRQFGFIHQADRIGPLGRPMNHPLRRRHQRNHPLGLAGKLAQIGRGKAQPQHHLAGDIGPKIAQPLANHMPGDLTGAAFIKFAKVYDVIPHAPEFNPTRAEAESLSAPRPRTSMSTATPEVSFRRKKGTAPVRARQLGENPPAC